MEDNFKELQTLLRQRQSMHVPPPQYFDDFLQEFHRRQRTELLKRSVLRIVLDRVESLFANPVFSFYTPPKVALAYAATLVAALGFTTFTVVNRSSLFNHNASELAVVENIAATAAPKAADSNYWFANRPVHLEEATYMTSGSEGNAHTAYHQQPRYVLDAQPVRYDASPASF